MFVCPHKGEKKWDVGCAHRQCCQNAYCGVLVGQKSAKDWLGDEISLAWG